MKICYLMTTGSSWERVVLDQLGGLGVEVVTAAEGADLLVTASPDALAVSGEMVRVHHCDLVPGSGALERLVRVDAVVTTSLSAATWLTDSLGPASPVVAPLARRQERGPGLRSSLTAPVVSVSGRAEPGLRAFGLVAERFPDWSLQVYAEGAARREALRLVDALGLHDQVFVSAPTSCLAKSSVHVVLDGLAEQALDAGVPVVGYARPELEELVRHDVNGRLVAEGDVSALAGELAALMADETTRVRLGSADQAHASLGSAGDRLMEFYERLHAERAQLIAARTVRLAAHADRAVGAFVPAAAALPAVGGSRRASREVLVRDDLGPFDVARFNRDAVIGALRDAGVPYLTVPDPGLRQRVAVTEPHHADAVAAVARLAGMRAQPIKPAPGTPPSGRARDVGGWPAPGGLRLFHVVAPAVRTVEYGADCACDLEFWTATEGGWKSTRPTRLGSVIPADAVTDLPFADEVTFPIDAVYTWVDGSDPAWLARKAATGLAPSNADGGPGRYASRDELRYSLRSLAMHAPWIRTIWLVTDRQTPAWLDTAHPGVRVVDHRDIFDDPGALPTFNSHAIETRLHHIDGLAEHFLYLNDDFFLGRPLTPGHFFHPNGLTKIFPSSTTIPPTPRSGTDPTWTAAAKNNRALIEREFGRTFARAFKHAPYALRRSVLRELEERFPQEIAATSRSRFRSVRDVSLVSSLYHYYALCTGRATIAELSVDTVPLSDGDALAPLTRLLTLRDRDTFCLNDMASGDLSEEDKARVVHGFLAGYLPIRSPYER
ncbi:stealth conserved region 3 domain-containing protein [Nonomuraea sp. NPDC050556]|uniref:stealth conserved region 3 domain-containing protein n=1 Tax=Nonomuraea sp. NPDC050556 TaxID=3364369 RepID=UPI0037AABF63